MQPLGLCLATLSLGCPVLLGFLQFSLYRNSWSCGHHTKRFLSTAENGIDGDRRHGLDIQTSSLLQFGVLLETKMDARKGGAIPGTLMDASAESLACTA